MSKSIVVITGSSRGIGYGLADALLARGCLVVVSSRSAESVTDAVARLHQKHSSDRVVGYACDVGSYQSVQGLWDTATARFGGIDIWINNAGQSTPPRSFWQLDDKQIASVVDTNLTGTMNGARVALEGMLAQGHGRIFNFGGLGSNGMKVSGTTLYGTTKYAIQYFTDALVEEVKRTPVQVGFILPGMVVTDLLTESYDDWPEDKRRIKGVFNILADRVETVTPWLADQILTANRNGARIRWLTKQKILWRFLMAPFQKRNLFSG
ncbi:SDR family oxidoreductase [Nibrella saemangeumensis]|uniref:SDR family oxidoreductase n=1 Tax=Nibrella saemangeumensis TaxID=1084526 RepID=A0ABP8N808_9BACT